VLGAQPDRLHVGEWPAVVGAFSLRVAWVILQSDCVLLQLAYALLFVQWAPDEVVTTVPALLLASPGPVHDTNPLPLPGETQSCVCACCCHCCCRVCQGDAGKSYVTGYGAIQPRKTPHRVRPTGLRYGDEPLMPWHKWRTHSLAHIRACDGLVHLTHSLNVVADSCAPSCPNEPTSACICPCSQAASCPPPDQSDCTFESAYFTTGGMLPGPGCPYCHSEHCLDSMPSAHVASHTCNKCTQQNSSAGLKVRHEGTS
jgi:hypothetical protein